MMDQLELKAQITVTDEGEVRGLAWPHGAGPCQHGDTIVPGAFNIPAEGLPMLLNHDPEAVVGLWESIEETPEGLSVKGALFIKEDRRARAVRSMLKSGLVSGLSIGFRTRAAEGRPGARTITSLDLVEVSVVRNPAHPRARITGAKNASAALQLAGLISRAAEALQPRK